MTTPEREIKRHYRRGHRHADSGAFMQESEMGRRGRHAGHHARRAFEDMRGEEGHGRRHGRGHLYRTIQQLQEQVNELERSMRRMQRRAKFQAMNRDEQVDVHETRRKIVRTRRGSKTGRVPSGAGIGRHMHGEGRRMGRIAHRAWRDRQPDA